MVEHDSPTPNLAHDGVEYVTVGLTIGEDDLAMRRAVSLAGVKLVFAEVEIAGAFEVRGGFGSDLETECGSEWAACVCGLVNGGDVVEELRTG